MSDPCPQKPLPGAFFFAPPPFCAILKKTGEKEGTALWYEAVAQFLDTALLAGGFVLAVAAGYAVTKYLRGKK